MTKIVVVLDPGHGGTKTTGNSSWNNATSASGVLEKTMTLRMAKLVRNILKDNAILSIYLTRSTDVNLGLSARANIARDKGAILFLSIHYNGYDKKARGVETWVRSKDHGNYNYAEDVVFARRIQKSVYNTIKKYDPKTRNRGVRAKRLGVLSDPQLGNTPDDHPCRSCLVEIEFIDVPAVDELLNTGTQAMKVQSDIATAIADSILKELVL